MPSRATSLFAQGVIRGIHLELTERKLRTSIPDAIDRTVNRFIREPPDVFKRRGEGALEEETMDGVEQGFVAEIAGATLPWPGVRRPQRLAGAGTAVCGPPVGEIEDSVLAVDRARDFGDWGRLAFSVLRARRTMRTSSTSECSSRLCPRLESRCRRTALGWIVAGQCSARSEIEQRPAPVVTRGKLVKREQRLRCGRSRRTEHPRWHDLEIRSEHGRKAIARSKWLRGQAALPAAHPLKVRHGVVT